MEKMKYKISSRAAILLGRESVSKVEGALIELIKNSYDADADLCYVCFDIKSDNLYIIDNGSGMTRTIIEDNWMMIGTDNKKKEYISSRDRIKSGEKGIGRFALDRLGRKCELYTKNRNEPRMIHWLTNWDNFELEGKELGDVEAEFEYIQAEIVDFIPENIIKNISKLEKNISDSKEEKIKFKFYTGTIIKICGLRDEWDENGFQKLWNSLEFLIPPTEQDDFFVCTQNAIAEGYRLIENDFSEEYDYKIESSFDGEKFVIDLFRNELDLDRIPKALFKEERFIRYPYRNEDLKKKSIKLEYTIAQLFTTDDENIIKSVKRIGPFKFSYLFMKLAVQKRGRDIFYSKQIGSNRKAWLEEHGGVKIYRDNFWVRPYGDASSDSFDWLGLEARNNSNPVAVSDKSEAWTVRNAQGQGTVFISRVANDSILDKSSREGIIENDTFKIFKESIKNIISVLEKDRAYIARGMKLYDDKINEKEKTKKSGSDLATRVLSGKENNKKNSKQNIHELAKTVQYYQEERDELITELKLLRSLATSGLLTTSIVHDLKGINALLVNRVQSLKLAINHNDEELIKRNIDDLYQKDEFLKSWITVVTNQTKKDKRKRIKKDLYSLIENTILGLSSILEQKHVIVKIIKDSNATYKRIFETDFESLMYNLLINSIEAFSKSKTSEREIEIELTTSDQFIIRYQDNGCGISNIFKDPYDIFKLGTTSKYDQYGNVIGTGLGMYIVSSTINEYGGTYKITEYVNGFGLEMKFPL